MSNCIKNSICSIHMLKKSDLFNPEFLKIKLVRSQLFFLKSDLFDLIWVNIREIWSIYDKKWPTVCREARGSTRAVRSRKSLSEPRNPSMKKLKHKSSRDFCWNLETVRRKSRARLKAFYSSNSLKLIFPCF